MAISSWNRGGAAAVSALLIAAATYYLEPVIGPVVLQGVFGVHHFMVAGTTKEFALLPFTAFLSVRTLCYLLGFALLLLLARFDFGPATLGGPHRTRHLGRGLLTGILVMAGAILAIIVSGAAHAAYLQDSPIVAAGYGLAWLATSVIGAAAEEIFYRGLLFIALDRVGGKVLAIVGSALAFAWMHGANPGASPIWLVRLFCQGLLLAYAVIRTGSLWWSIGYHAGWNWASAPLFGAAGSGYGNEGHVLTFSPTGSAWITGGDVGPEGSIFAFVAVMAAAGLLLATTRRVGETAPR